MQKSKEIELDGERYFVNMYLMTQGFALWGKLGKIIGKPLAMVMGEAQENNFEKLGEAVESLFSSVPPEELPKLAKEILSTTEVVIGDSKQPIAKVFDVHFQGRMMHLFKLLKDVLEFQYGDVFQGLTANLESAQAVRAKPILTAK